MINWLKINGVSMPAPVTFKVTLSDLDSENTTRNEAGIMKRDRIRAGVYKISLTYRVQIADLKKLVSAISPESFKVTFFDPNTYSSKTTTMYCGDRESEIVMPNNATDSNTWVDLSFNLIEF